jgi:hypothetical protein
MFLPGGNSTAVPLPFSRHRLIVSGRCVSPDAMVLSFDDHAHGMWFISANGGADRKRPSYKPNLKLDSNKGITSDEMNI